MSWNNQDWDTFEKRHRAQVVVTWPGKPIARFTGAMKGSMKGPDGKEIPPTGKAFEVDFCTVAKWDEQGQIIEENLFDDLPGLMKQVGLG